MDIIMPDALDIQRIVKESERFAKEPDNYYIWMEQCQTGDVGQEDIMRFYLGKLQYAVTYADVLIQNAFQSDFYEFYGVNQDVVKSPEDMCKQLVFDSFVLAPEQRTIGACLSNDAFMFGHFIEFCWDYDWNLEYWRIC